MDQNYTNQQSFWQFSDQLRLHAATLPNLSTNDSIWSNSFVSRKNHNNFDVRVGAELQPPPSNSNPKLPYDLNTFHNDGWNSFKTGGSDLLSSLNPKPLRSGDSLKDPVNDYGMWNSLKLGTGSDVLGSSLNPKQLGSGKTNPKDPVNDFGAWNSFKPGIGSNLLLNPNANRNPFGLGGNLKDPVNDYGIWNNLKAKTSSDYNGFNDGWKINSNGQNENAKEMGIKNGGGNYSKGLFYKLGAPANSNGNLNWKKGREDQVEQGGKKGSSKKGKNESGTAEKEKRFKTLPAAEALPRNERIGGYIFVCNNDTMAENLKRQLFGLPPRYRDSVRSITPGLPLFLYNYSTHQLHGVFEAASFGGTNIDPTAWEDKKCPGESRFPAQVRVITREICEPLEEDSFRPILHHYDGPKFRLELTIPEAISLLDVLSHQHS